MTMSMAAPAVRAVAGQKSKAAVAQKAFMGRGAAGSKVSVADAFSAMSLSTPKQARSLSICGAYLGRARPHPRANFRVDGAATAARVGRRGCGKSSVAEPNPTPSRGEAFSRGGCPGVRAA